MKTPVTVSILGQEYTLISSEETEAELRQAAHRVDAAMHDISSSGKLHARERIAVLAALRIAAQQIQAPPAPHADSSHTLQHPRLQAALEQAEALLAAHGTLPPAQQP